MARQKLCHRIVEKQFKHLLTDEVKNMLQVGLIIAGLLLLITHQYVHPFSEVSQVNFFLAGILLLGVPHGAADLLVAMQNAGSGKKTFSKIRFFINYLSRLIIFGLLLWLFPLLGIILFIVFAAYHFGETDLHQFKTDLFSGKVVVTVYGMVVLSVLLLNHLEDVMTIMEYVDSGSRVSNLFILLDTNKIAIILSAILILCIVSLYYLYINKIVISKKDAVYLARFVCVLYILYNLPLVLGFTFYFILWHSLLSMKNIIGYLRRDSLNKPVIILKQMIGYSSLAIAGILLAGQTGLMFLNTDAFLSYIFMGLAVLTAPHMQIMHDMYIKIRSA
jgi:Brp/Blh family beta-carotene 15,15'-monooxygenase